MKIKLLIAITWISIPTLSQVRVTNQSLTDSSLSIVYINPDNEMLIHGFELDMNSRVIVSNALITLTGPKTFILRPAIADSAIVTIHKDGQLLYRKAFKTQPLPEPVVKLGNIRSIDATIDEILANTTVSIELPGCYYKHSLIPVSYRFRIENDATQYKYSKTNLTNQLTEEQKELLKLCIPNTSVIIDAVMTGTKDGKKNGTALSQLIVVK
jgi:hypothetical protein